LCSSFGLSLINENRTLGLVWANDLFGNARAEFDPDWGNI
jgi:hypothetical protein